MKERDVYGMGQPLMDVIVDVDDAELKLLGLNKGIMHLIGKEDRENLLNLLERKDKKLCPGGDVPNTIMALSSLGLRTIFAGKVGRDIYGPVYERGLVENNVIPQLRMMEGLTGISIIMVTPDGERTMNTHLASSEHFTISDLDPEAVSQSSFLYLSGYMWNLPEQKEAMRKAIMIAKQSGTRIIFDVADPFVVRANRDDFLELIRSHVDVVFANKDESKILMGTDDPENAAYGLSRIADYTVVKVGSDGALVIRSGGELRRIPANRVDAIDTTGAGDMFAAGFIYGLVKDMALADAGLFASYLASEIVRQKGAQLCTENREMVLKRIASGSWKFIEI